jgi:hypothetical protein
MYISEPNGGSELSVLNVEPSAGHQVKEGRNSRTPYECKSGIRLTTFPSFRAWTFSFSSSLEPDHRSGGVRFSVAQ